MQTRHAQRKYVICAVMLLFTATLVNLILARRQTSVKASGQDSQERLLKRLPLEENEPISITSVTVKGKRVVVNQKFVAPDDWPSGLTIGIKNKSSKFILLASIDLKFPRPAGSEGLKMNYTLVYGNPDLQLRPATTPELSTGISPGQSATIEFAPSNFEIVRKHLTDKGFPPGIERIEFSIGTVIFQDDTMWYAGSLLRRDPRNVKTWINTEISPAPNDKSNSPSKSVQLPTARKRFAHALTKPIVPDTECHPFGQRQQPDCGVYNENCHYWKEVLNTSITASITW
jgi:hypothetical protein